MARKRSQQSVQDRTQGDQTTRQAGPIDPSNATSESRSGSPEAIVFPSRASAMQRAHEIVRQAPDTRADLVEQLRHDLKQGALMADSDILADKLIGIQLYDLRSAA